MQMPWYILLLAFAVFALLFKNPFEICIFALVYDIVLYSAESRLSGVFVMTLVAAVLYLSSEKLRPLLRQTYI
jgi:hypothetical protein